MFNTLKSLLPLALLLSGLLLPCSAGASSLILQAQRLLDVENGEIIPNAQILIVDGKIAAINPEAIPADTVVIDLGDRTLLPGLIDTHVHLTSSGPRFSEQILTENAAASALRGVETSRVTLMAGFTTVRDMAQLIPSPILIAVALADAIDKGWVVGPRIITAGHALSITGGQIDPAMWVGSAEGILKLGTEFGIADGVDEVIKATRYQIKHGAKVIKVAATTGVMSRQGGVGVQQYSELELRAIVEEAARHNIRVAAHAQGATGINAAIRAGVASIEHGWMLDKESIRLMKKRGTFLVPTMSPLNATTFDHMPEPVREKARIVFPLAKKSLARAVGSGVKIAMGSDAPMIPHGENAREIIAMVELGMSPLDAIRAATLNAAQLLGTEDRGQLKPGLLADIIAVDGNPLNDIGEMATVRFVMKGGKVYKQPAVQETSLLTYSSEHSSELWLEQSSEQSSVLSLELASGRVDEL